MAKPLESVRLEFSSRVLWLELVQALADDFSARAGFDEEQRFRIAMAIREGINNAIVHGNGRDEAKTVEVDLLRHEDRLEIRVRDQGPGFDSGRLPDPVAPENLLRSSGRGVFLIRHYMDAVDLKQASERGGEVRMTKWLPGRGLAAPGQEPEVRAGEPRDERNPCRR